MIFVRTDLHDSHRVLPIAFPNKTPQNTLPGPAGMLPDETMARSRTAPPHNVTSESNKEPAKS